MDRRNFLQSLAGLGVAASGWPGAALLARAGGPPAYFGLHPFIDAHPEAVFIRKTAVKVKDDSGAKRREAFEFAKRIFTLRHTPGIPLSDRFAIKPNLTATDGTGLRYAIVTDPFVVEGFVAGLGNVGIDADSVYVRDGLWPDQPGIGYREMSQRSGVHYDDSDSREPESKECPDGVVFRRTKYLGPFNYPESHLFSISKMKAHGMGLTLCVKNLQGTNAQPYLQFCGGLQRPIAQDFQTDAQRHVGALYATHRQAGIPRWDTERGEWMEMWAQRTLDSYTLIRPSIQLNIIEAVYAQNGDGFRTGPGPHGEPEVFMTNMLIFGKDAFRVDIIGHWLGGHEPGNFGLFHLAKERGLSSALNPHNVPIYLWEDNGPKLTPLDQFPRTPLTTTYLPKQGESPYHLCNQPFAYPTETHSACLTGGEAPGLRLLGHAKLGKGPSSLLFEYNLPADGHAAVEMYDALGRRVGVLAQGWTRRGVHLADWNTEDAAPGLYSCRLTAAGVTLAEPAWA